MIVILGATGYVGNALVRTLSNRLPELEVRAVGRNHTKLRALESVGNVGSTVSWEQGQPLDPILDGAETVVDLSYNITGIPSEVMRVADTHGRELVAAAARNHLHHVNILSSVAVYGEPKIHYNWRAPPAPAGLRPNTIYGMSKARTERAAAKTARSANLSVAILRSGHILGPGSSMATGIATALLSNHPTRLMERQCPSNATSIDGIIETIMKSLGPTENRGVRWGNHVDLDERSHETIVAMIAEAIGVRGVVASDDGPVTRRDRVLSSLRANKKRALFLQSRIGLYDFGLSAALLSSAKRRIGGSMGLLPPPSPGPDGDNKGLIALYASSPLPHTTELFGASQNDEEWRSMSNSIAGWLQSSGFVLPEPA